VRSTLACPAASDRLQFNQPKDHIAIALARSPQPVQLVAQTGSIHMERSPFALSLGSKPMFPKGIVEAGVNPQPASNLGTFSIACAMAFTVTSP
jgi:hypothetical protein